MSGPAEGRQTGSFGDELTNAAMIGLIGVFALALLLRAAGSVTAFLTGTAQPAAGPAAGVGVLFNPADPATALDAEGLNVVVYWIVAAVLLIGLGTGIGWVWTRLRRHSRQTATDPHRLAGIATKHEVTRTASSKALLARAKNLRPSLERPTPADVGYRIGTAHGQEVWASVEDSVLLIGPRVAASRCTSLSHSSWTRRARWWRPRPGPTTSPRACALASASARQRCSTRSTWPKGSLPDCAGRRSEAAKIP